MCNAKINLLKANQKKCRYSYYNPGKSSFDFFTFSD
jgi:hypothetical protein